MPLLYGIHDREGRHIVPAGGWCVDTIALSENAAPTNYTQLRGDINWLVRVNWGYGTTGTIPLPENDRLFVDRLAHYVHNSPGAYAWIIGNEPNHEQERPDGVYITPGRYADFFARARTLIKTINPQARVLPAACAPYHANPVPWTDYYREVLSLIEKSGGCDGLTLHTYTRSSNPADISNGARMGPPIEYTYSGFLSYLDALCCAPPSMLYLPAYITEFNELLEQGWDDRNTGVVRAAYADIHDWNHSDNKSENPIMCLCLYRWPRHDKWHIEGKQGVIDDFKAAVGRGYTSPVVGATVMPEQTFLPSTPNQSPSPTPDVPREWDERLTARGVTVETPPLAPGQQYWRVVKARWYDEQESQGRHHIYIEAPEGTPWRVTWPSGSHPGYANGKTGFDASNYPMSKSLNEFSVQIRGDMDIPSETLEGVGMGANGNPAIHTSTGVGYELATMPAAQPTPQPHPQPVEVQPVTGDNWARSIAFTARWEGGYQNVPNDAGNWTGGAVGVGENKGTNWGVSAASYPHLDIRNLTREQAHEIFKRDYWVASGADRLNWPACLIVFDTAILHGVGTAKAWQSEVGTNAFAFAAKRLRVYTKMKNWDYWGKGWVNRTAELLDEAAL